MNAPRKYSGDYELQDVPGKNGKGIKTTAVYRGDYWQCTLADADYRAALRRMLMLLSGISLLYIAMGLLPTGAVGSSGAAAPYVLLPYIAMLLPIGMSWGKTVLLFHAKRKLERREYDQWVVRLRGYSRALLVCAAAAGAGDLLYTLLHLKVEHVLSDVLFALASFIICGFCIGFVHIQNRCQWGKLDK